MDDPILTSREAAALLGVSVKTAQSWLESQKIRSWKTPGGHRRVNRSDVVKLKAALGSESADFVGAEVADESRRGVAHANRVFDVVTTLASAVTGAPIALMTELTDSRQWFTSRHGLDIDHTPRSWAFCNFAVLQRDVMVVNDATIDPRFQFNPLVTGPHGIRFYAGAPIRDAQGHPQGTLCVLDKVPRVLSAQQLEQLRALATLISAEIEKQSALQGAAGNIISSTLHAVAP